MTTNKIRVRRAGNRITAVIVTAPDLAAAVNMVLEDMGLAVRPGFTPWVFNHDNGVYTFTPRQV